MGDARDYSRPSFVRPPRGLAIAENCLALPRGFRHSCGLATDLLAFPSGRTMRRQTTISERSHLVRYRFDDPAQLGKHLHATDAHGRYLFLRDPGPQFGTGARVVLDVSFRANAHRCVLHGLVRLRDHGSRSSAWLEVPAAARVQDGYPSPTRRRWQRLPTDLMAEIRPNDVAPFLCRVLDLGPRGLRVFGNAESFGSGVLQMTLLPTEGSLPPVESGARVAWSRSHEVGIEILGTVAPSYPALLHSIEDAWGAADALSHPSSCTCSEGDLPDEWLVRSPASYS
jgi:hypothetical protein